MTWVTRTSIPSETADDSSYADDAARVPFAGEARVRKSNPPRTPSPERTTGRFPRPKNRSVEAVPRARGTNPVPTDLDSRTTGELPALDPAFRRRRTAAPVGATRE